MALGSMPEQFTNDLELDLDKYGYIIVDEKNRTSKAKIFAGGDIAGCKGTVAWAARSGRDAANSIDEYLKNIIVADLKSTDKTKEIVKKLAEEYQTIKPLSWKECKDIMDNIDDT